MKVYLIQLEETNKKLVPLGNLSNCHCKSCQKKNITFLIGLYIYECPSEATIIDFIIRCFKRPFLWLHLFQDASF